MDNKGTSINLLSQLVGVPHIIIHINGAAGKEAHVILAKYGLFGELGDGFYVVKPEGANALKARGIRYAEIARHPMPKEVRSEIRAELKKNGVSAPI